MLRDFAAIDFETANEQLSSVCSVGIVIVRDGIICDRFYSLIQPEPNYYTYGNSNVHGLTYEDTANAEVFSKVWMLIEPLVGELPLVAHNKGFDEACLKAVFKTYRMDYPDYRFYCTLAASRRQLRHLPDHQLHTVAEDCGYILTNHHNALADAEACAEIALQLL
jgi:DNA polymerase-3 subunit epsilon